MKDIFSDSDSALSMANIGDACRASFLKCNTEFWRVILQDWEDNLYFYFYKVIYYPTHTL